MLLGLTLRIWTVGSGVPFAVEDDEPVIMEKALQMMKSGDLNPHFFDYGGLTMYFHMIVATLRFIVGAMGGTFTSLDKMWEGDFYLWTRTATALVGTLTIYVMYRAALRWGTATALVTALLLAIYPHLVRTSHFALTDTPLTFLVALTLLLSLVAGEDGRARWFALAGLTAGLATATKYSGALALLMPLAAVATSKSVRVRTAAAVTTICGLFGGFLLASPYSLLDLPHFLDSFASLAQHYNQPKSAAEAAATYLKYFRGAFGFGWGGSWVMVGWPALLLSLAGLVRLVFQLLSPTRRAAAAIVLAFPVCYFWLISHQSLIFSRYDFPLVPMLCLGFGLSITTLRELLPSRRWVMALLLLLTIPPALQAVWFDVDRRKVTTEEQMAQWLERNISASDLIIIEPPRIRLPPPPRFKWIHSTRLTNETVDAYRTQGVTYLLGSSEMEDIFLKDEARFPVQVSEYRQVFASTQMVKIFQPTPDHPGATLTLWKIPR